jgi:hypothetical protein
MAISSLATIPFALVGPDSSTAWLATTLAVRGVGMGLVLTPVFTAAYAGLDRSAIPRAATLFNILNRVGGSLGTAVLAVVLQRELTRGAGAATGSTAHVTHSYGTAFGWALALSALGLIPALFLPGPARRRLGVSGGDAGGGRPAPAAR